MSRLIRLLIFNNVSLVAGGIAVSAVVLELGLRILLATMVGPDVLLFGTKYCCGPMEQLAFDARGAEEVLAATSHSVGVPDVSNAGYNKYRPGQSRSDYTIDGKSFDVRINNHGYRGNDFSLQKDPGVIRVVTLGGSSTFGYRSKDHETYPEVMEAILNQRLVNTPCDSVNAFEVINLGIPHMWTGNIRALLAVEGSALDPDIVTLYAGMNDAKPGLGLRERPGEYQLTGVGGDRETYNHPILVWVHYHFIYKLRAYLITSAMLTNLVDLKRRSFSPSVLEAYSSKKIVEFMKNMEAMNEMAERSGGKFIVANQQAHSSSYQLPVKGETYRQSVDQMDEKLHREGLNDSLELAFITHSRLMETLESWSKENRVSFVDVISALDARRDLMASYVHLSPAANRIVAEAFGDEVWSQTCGRNKNN